MKVKKVAAFISARHQSRIIRCILAQPFIAKGFTTEFPRPISQDTQEIIQYRFKFVHITSP